MTTTESLFDEIERNNIEVYLGSMPAAKSASANIGDDYYIALDEQSLESTAEARCRLAHEAGHCITGSTTYMPRLTGAVSTNAGQISGR